MPFENRCLHKLLLLVDCEPETIIERLCTELLERLLIEQRLRCVQTYMQDTMKLRIALSRGKLGDEPDSD